MINKLLETIIQEERNENSDIAVLLSGGVDSNTCLFTSYKLGLSVHGYSFHIEGNPTYE